MERFVPTWMKIAPSNAATNASASKWPAPSASDVPTSTGAIAAGSVRTRAAITQIRTALAPPGAACGGCGAVCAAVIAQPPSSRSSRAHRRRCAHVRHYARRGNREKSGRRFCL